MTTATVPAPSTRTDAPPASSAYRLSFGHLLRSEWIKLTTLRSTWWSIGLVALVSIGLSLLMATSLASFAGDVPPMPVVEANRQAVQVVVFSTVLTQLLAMILGTITVTGEYSTGMIRSTLTAAPVGTVVSNRPPSTSERSESTTVPSRAQHRAWWVHPRGGSVTKISENRVNRWANR